MFLLPKHEFNTEPDSLDYSQKFKNDSTQLLIESFTLFISKLFKAFDHQGEMDYFWTKLKVKLQEEKDASKVFTFVTTMSIPPQKVMLATEPLTTTTQTHSQHQHHSSYQYHSRASSLKQFTLGPPPRIRSSKNIESNEPTKQAKRNESTEDFGSPPLTNKRQPTRKQSQNIKTVQIDMQVSSPLKYNNLNQFPYEQQYSLPSTKRGSIFLKSDSLNSESHASNNSTAGSNGLSYLSKKSNRRPSFINDKLGTLSLQQTLSSSSGGYQSNSTNLSGYSHHLAKRKSIMKNDSLSSYPTQQTQESPPCISPLIRKSSSSKQKVLKRFTPQQIIRMDSLPSEEEINMREIDSLKNGNEDVISHLLSLVQVIRTTFSKDSETLHMINDRSTLASINNCKNSIGVEFLKHVPTSHLIPSNPK